MASGGETSSNHRRKRDDGDDMEDDGETSCGKRSLVSVVVDDDDRDYIYEYDDDESDDRYDISDAEEDTTTKVAVVKKPYVILTEEEVRSQQEEDTAKVAEVLSISPPFAAFLLRRYKWMPTNLQDDWFSDDRRRPASAAGGRRSAACGTHFYCDACWRGYVGAAVGDGAARCLSLRCPDPACPAAVSGDLLAAVATAADADRYARFAFRSYVEDNGGRRIKWCPGRGCARAVEFLGFSDDASPEIFCGCGHGFCWNCGEEAHRPVTCGTVRAWLAKNKSDSETANWVLANTKLCPMCHKAIEKKPGMQPHEVPLWAPLLLALLKAGVHGLRAALRLRRLRRHRRKSRGGESKEEATARRARASLDRYIFHYERWAGNLRSLEKARQDMDELERLELEGMAAAVGRPVTELAFVKEAYEQVVYGRRVLRWAHAYGYYLDPETDGTKRRLFDFLQGQANESLEKLHEAAELERKDVFRSRKEGETAVDVARRYKEYQQKMLPLTAATRKFVGNLVKAFETDLPEVGTMNF
ncbi:unnamed protein product [Urochloa humidicola]